MKVWPVIGGALAATVVVAGKHYYREASPGELDWLLAPIAHAVGAITGAAFAFDPAHGWVSREARFVIAPVCAGLNFALAAFLALAVGWLGGMRTWRGMARRLAAAVVVGYAATLVVNTIRIAIAIRMHQSPGMSGGELHRLEGVVVYLGGLCALYAAARALDGRHEHATP